MGFFYNRDKYTVAYNGVSCNRYGLYLKARPNIPTGREIINEYDVLGRDGKMYISTGLVEDREITCEIGFFGEPNTWTNQHRAIKTWLNTSNNKRFPFNTLQFSDDTRYYYCVKKITLETTEREAKDIGKAEIKFIVSGYDYKQKGFEEIRMESGKWYNDNRELWQPILRIARGYDDITGIARAKIITKNEYNLIGDELEFALSQGETMIVNFYAPVAYVWQGANDPEQAFNRIKGNFTAIKKDTPIKWERITANAQIDFYVTPLYKEL